VFGFGAILALAAHLEAVTRARAVLSAFEPISPSRRCLLSFEAFQQVLSVAAPLAITLGVVVALLNLRNQYRLRQIDTVMRLYSHFGDDTFVRRFIRVTNWDYDT
jgi:hypothetical protein